MDEEAVKWSAERVGKELNFIQTKLIHVRESLDRTTEALMLSAYVQASHAEGIDPNIWEYIRSAAEDIVKKNSAT